MARGTLNVHLIRGDVVLTRLSDPGFAAGWRAVFDACPWATPNQSLEFAQAWYSTYAGFWEPILVTAEDADRVIGIMALAVRGSRLVVCGADDAEYHGWICLPDMADQFIVRALGALWESFPAGRLTFRRLPPQITTDWCSERNRALAGSVSLPILTIANGDAARKHTTVAGARALQLIEVTTAQELATHISTIAAFWDFRQGALTGQRPFHDDRLKARLYLNLAEIPGLLHITILSAGTDVLSAHIGTRHQGRVSLGILAHSPFQPAETEAVHVRMLVDLLRRQGCHQLALDSAHRDLADGQEHGSSAEVFASADQYHHARKQQESGTGLGRPTALARLRSGVQRVATQWLRPKIGQSLIRSIRFRLYSSQELRCYSQPAGGPEALVDEQPLAVNRLEHLILYDPVDPKDRPVSVFLSDCLTRCQAGDWVYTAAENGRLIHHAWMGRRLGRVPTDLPGYFDFPPGSVTLWDDYTHPSGRGRGWHTRSLRQRVREARSRAEAETAFIFVFADNTASRKNIERTGFRYHSSLFRRIVLGRRRSYWATES